MNIIEYSPKSFGQEYSYMTDTRRKVINEPFNNSDLPFLRSKFLQYKIHNIYPDIKEPIILEGEVAHKIDDKLRNAYMILYIDWESENIKIKN